MMRVIERTGKIYVRLAESVSGSTSSTTVQRLNESGPHQWITEEEEAFLIISGMLNAYIND